LIVEVADGRASAGKVAERVMTDAPYSMVLYPSSCRSQMKVVGRHSRVSVA
jgi:hypothetical protein